MNFDAILDKYGIYVLVVAWVIRELVPWIQKRIDTNSDASLKAQEEERAAKLAEDEEDRQWRRELDERYITAMQGFSKSMMEFANVVTGAITKGSQEHSNALHEVALAMSVSNERLATLERGDAMHRAETTTAISQMIQAVQDIHGAQTGQPTRKPS